MRWFGLVPLVLGTGFLCLAQLSCSYAQAPDATSQADPADKLRVAPNAPRWTPEVRSEPADGVGKADICLELVAFIQKAAAETSKANPATNAAAQPPSAPPAGATNNAFPDTSQRQSGLSAPIPPDDAAPAPTKLSLEQAQSLAEAHDLRGCRRAAQQMRRAGVALPPGLLALAALREELLGEMPQSAR
jgi:hypothetical protein